MRDLTSALGQRDRVRALVFQRADLIQPCVYVATKRGTVTYIGVGTKGLARAFVSGEELRKTALQDCDKLEVSFFADSKSAREQEKNQIHIHHPEFNRACPKCPHYREKYPASGKRGLFGRSKQAVLGLLLANPEKAYYVREIAKLTGLRGGGFQRELKKLDKIGILRSQPRGNQLCYQAEERYPAFLELQSIVAQDAQRERR